MAKKHPRPSTKNLLPDLEDFDYVRDKERGMEEEAPPRPAKVAVNYSAPQAHREGTVVTIAALQLSGTVVQCVGKDLMVLDSTGIMHRLEAKDVYVAQSNS